MSIATTAFSTIEADHTVKVPATMPVGGQVLIVQMPVIKSLLNDPARRARFAATRRAIQQALTNYHSESVPSNEEIVALVKRARQATQSN